MALTCTDIDKLVHPYLDGELPGEDGDALDVHMAGCDACREAVGYERSFKQALRSKLASPAPSSDLRARMVATLDEVDQATGEREPMWEFVLNRGAMIAAAAAIVLFVLMPNEPTPTSGASGSRVANENRQLVPAPVVPTTSPTEMLVNRHFDRPIEVDQAAQLPAGFDSRVGVRVEPPRFAGHASLRRAWINDFPDRRAAQLEYVTRDAEGHARVFSVHVFDPANMKVRADAREHIGDIEVLAGRERGLNFVFYQRDGVGYAYTSDLERDALMQLVRTSLTGGR